MNNFNQQSFAARGDRVAALAVPASATLNALKVLAFLLLHIPLAILMSRVPTIATLHAFATFAVGLWWAVSAKPMEKVAYAGAYIVGAEVLWRMTGAKFFWEGGKYGIAAIFILSLLRHQRFRPKQITLVYLALMLPAIILTTFKLDLSASRDNVSFYISGHLAIVASIWFFSAQTLTRTQLQKLFLSIIAPITGVAAIATFGIVVVSSIKFTDESNLVTSGGFGPNQVSAIFGLGALLAFLYVLENRVNPKLKIAIFVVMMVLAAQSALTFSRGGLYNAAGAAILASFYLVRDARKRLKLLGVISLVMLIGYFLILPRLNAFTGGALATRFQDTDPTGRIPLIISDLGIWKDNFFLGVGLGQSRDLRGVLFRSASAHTEFSRMLSEQGVFGLLMIILLLRMAVQNLARARTPAGKALVAALLGWSFLFMFNAAMRLAAPAFLIGLSFATILAVDKDVLAKLRMWLQYQSSSISPLKQSRRLLGQGRRSTQNDSIPVLKA